MRIPTNWLATSARYLGGSTAEAIYPLERTALECHVKRLRQPGVRQDQKTKSDFSIGWHKQFYGGMIHSKCS